MAKKKTHGGRREGAGRPFVEDKPKIRAVKLSDEHVKIAQALGNGDMTAGIRIALDRAAKKLAPKRKP